MQVQVIDAPGFVDRFDAILIARFPAIAPDAHAMSVVRTSEADWLCVPSRCVHTPEEVKTMEDREDHYRQEWATKTGKTPREIYVPEAIRKVEEKKEKK